MLETSQFHNDKRTRSRPNLLIKDVWARLTKHKMVWAWHGHSGRPHTLVREKKEKLSLPSLCLPETLYVIEQIESSQPRAARAAQLPN